MAEKQHQISKKGNRKSSSMLKISMLHSKLEHRSLSALPEVNALLGFNSNPTSVLAIWPPSQFCQNELHLNINNIFNKQMKLLTQRAKTEKKYSATKTKRTAC